MNIVVAMAGLGSRFQEQGHLYPKPLIRTGNTTMIQNVYYSLEWPDADWHFVVKMQHLKDHPFMKSLLESMGSITAIEETTQGAAETLQKCSEVMTSSNPFISVNCDQVFEWDTTSLQNKMKDNPDTSYITQIPNDIVLLIPKVILIRFIYVRKKQQQDFLRIMLLLDFIIFITVKYLTIVLTHY